MDRRAVFFLFSSLISLVLIWPTPTELHWVGMTLAIAFAVLALASWADHRSRVRAGSSPDS